MDAYEAHDDAKLRKRIGWMNRNGFDHCISYDKVSEASDGLSIGKVLEVLKHVERVDAATKVKDPTKSIVASLKAARERTFGVGGMGVRRTIGKQ